MKRNTKTPIHLNTHDEHVKRTRQLYIIGAAACVLADELSDARALDILKPLEAINCDLASLSTVPALIPAGRVARGTHRYTTKMERGTGTKAGKAPKEAVEQYAQSGDVFYRVLEAMYEIPTKHHEQFDEELRALVEKFKNL